MRLLVWCVRRGLLTFMILNLPVGGQSRIRTIVLLVRFRASLHARKVVRPANPLSPDEWYPTPHHWRAGLHRFFASLSSMEFLAED